MGYPSAQKASCSIWHAPCDHLGLQRVVNPVEAGAKAHPRF
jgi:hypothetical protein